MATDAVIQRWDRILNEIEIRRQSFLGPLEVYVPSRVGFARDFPVIVDSLTKPFLDAWNSDRPTEGTILYAILEAVAAAATDFDPASAVAPQVDRFMAAVAEGRSKLAEINEDATAEDVIADIEKLLKVSVLVARVSHQGAMQLADKEIKEQEAAINKGHPRAAKYLDLNTMLWVDEPSASTLSLSVFLAMADSGIATLEERLRLVPDVSTLPDTMKQFTAQWVTYVYTEWEEHYRHELAAALGCESGDIKSPYFADLRNMRHDYLHNRGICRNSAKNKMLKWFIRGQRMIPTHSDYIQLLADFPADELAVKPPPAVAQRQPVRANADPTLIRQFETVADTLKLTKDAALDQALSTWIATNVQDHPI
jgi:hypothetical protein